MKKLNKEKIYMFLRRHPTFESNLRVRDEEFLNFFNIRIGDYNSDVKPKMYTMYKDSRNHILELVKMGYTYDQAYSDLKAHGMCLPIRIQNWGYREPISEDEMIDYLKKNKDRFWIIYQNAKERHDMLFESPKENNTGDDNAKRP